MATATREAAHKRELIEEQKQLLEQRVDRGTADVKEALDWKARLRQDGPRIAAVGGLVVVLVVGSLVLRHRLRGGKNQGDQPARTRGDIDSLIVELQELREEIHKQRKSGGGGLAGKIAVAAVSAAASAAGKQAAGKLIDRPQDRAAA